MNKATAERCDIYSIVTEQVIAALEAGTVPWHRPWDAAQGSPVSIGSNKAYRGINVFLLEASAMAAGYRSPWWGTYKAISEQGGQVRKGEKSTLAVFWTKWRPKDAGDEWQKNTRARGEVLRYYRVFNAEQADGLPARFLAAPSSPSDFDAIAECEEIMAGYLNGPKAPTLAYGGSAGATRQVLIVLSLPERSAFQGADVLLLDRVSRAHSLDGARVAGSLRKDLLEFHRFGDASYCAKSWWRRWARPMLSAVAGIDQTHGPAIGAAYLASWLRVLRGDTRLVVTAAAAGTEGGGHGPRRVLCAGRGCLSAYTVRPEPMLGPFRVVIRSPTIGDEWHLLT